MQRLQNTTQFIYDVICKTFFRRFFIFSIITLLRNKEVYIYGVNFTTLRKNIKNRRQKSERII